MNLNKNEIESGALYIVGTPIGNLEDMTFRAVHVLKNVQYIAAEDTRHTGQLLKHFDIKNQLLSYHDFNKNQKADLIIHKLSTGNAIALVTDAGTPGISDPAYVLINKAIEMRIKIIPVPGATAAITGLSVSGLPTDRFVFEGFIPVKKGRKKRLESLTEEARSMIFYESPHRVLKTLNDFLTYFGDRDIVICRELTKKFEEIIRGSLVEMIEEFNNRSIKGEFTLILKGFDRKNATI